MSENCQAAQIVGLTFTGKAAQELQDGAGIPSCTIDRYLKYNDASHWDICKHHGKQLIRAAQKKRTFTWDALKITSDSIIVIDEASQASRSKLIRLVKSLEQRSGGPKYAPKIVWMGDHRQLQAIWHPGTFEGISRRLNHAELKNIVRQKSDWARQAVLDFAEGNARKGLAAYASRGLLKIAANRQQAHKDLIHDWAQRASHDVRGCLILAATNSEVRALNSQAQAARQAMGQIGRSMIRLGDCNVHEKDRVIFTKNNRLLGVKNGQLAIVEGIDARSRHLSVRLDNQQRVVVPLDYYSDLSLGYAITVMKSQGCTTQHCFVIAGGSMQDREMSTVAMSRASDLTRLYTDRFEAGSELQGLIKQMERSRRQPLATDLQTDQKVERQLNVVR